jgi:hypothetical protein
MATSDPVPFGITVSADNLEGAPEFYTDMYPNYISITEGVFGTIKYFSLIGQDGEVLVNVLQKQAGNRSTAPFQCSRSIPLPNGLRRSRQRAGRS